MSGFPPILGGIPQQSQPGNPTPAPGIGPPFHGLYLDRPAHIVAPSGFSACNNVRIRFNQVWCEDMGWRRQYNGANGVAPLFIPSGSAAGGIMGGGLFTLSTAGWQYLILITQGDIYAITQSAPPPGFLNPSPFKAVFITPVYTTGTVDCDGAGNLTGHGTLWNTAIGTGFRNNMRVNDYISFGSTTNNDPGNVVVWHQITSVASDTSATIADAGPVTAGQVYTLRQCLSNNLYNSRPVMESFPNAGSPDNQDLLFIVNHGGMGKSSVPASVDPIVVWNPTQAFATYLSTVGFAAGKIRRFSNVMIYGELWGVSGATPAGWLGATSIQSSDNGLPKAMAGGVTFQGVVSDGAEPIQHLGILGNQLLIYTGGQAPNTIAQSMSPGQGGSVVSASFVGLPTIWQFATVIRGRGTLGQGLVAEFADRHQFLAQDGEYRYNGMFLQVMNDHVFRALMTQIDYAHLMSAFNIVDPQAGELIWILPTSANGTNNIWAAYTEHYMEMANSYLFKPITIRDGGDQNTLDTFQCFLGASPNRAVLATTGLQGALIGTSSGNVLQIGIGAGDAQIWGNNAATSISETFTFGARIIAGERSRGLVKRIYPFVDEVNSTGTTLTVSLQLADRVGAAPAITDVQTYTTGTVTRFTTHYRRGRVGAVQFTFNSAVSGSIGLNMRFNGYDWDLPFGKSKGGQR